MNKTTKTPPVSTNNTQNSSTKTTSLANHQNNQTSSSKLDKSKDTSHSWIMATHIWWVDALLFIGGTILLGGLATLLGGKMFNFKNYQMPPATVPKIVFPIAWAIIYIAIGVSTYLMWRDKEIKSDGRKINLILYFVHMFFNVLWPLFFFRLNLPIVAVVWLIIMIGIALVVMYRYFVTNLPAGIIFTIYTAWLIYALYLNLGLVLINF